MKKLDLNTMTEKDLWIEYKKNHDIEIRNFLAIKYIGLVKKIADKVFKKLNGCISDEDLISYGFLGLLDAIEKYNLNKGFVFTTYAYMRITGAMYDGVRSFDETPRHWRDKLKQIEKASEILIAKLGRNPTRQELVKWLGISLADYEKILLKQEQVYSELSLNEYCEDDEDYTFIDTIEDSENNDDFVEKEFIKQIFNNSKDRLSEAEFSVIDSLYFKELKPKEVANFMNITMDYVSHIKSSALRKLKPIFTEAMAS